MYDMAKLLAPDVIDAPMMLTCANGCCHLHTWPFYRDSVWSLYDEPLAPDEDDRSWFAESGPMAAATQSLAGPMPARFANASRAGEAVAADSASSPAAREYDKCGAIVTNADDQLLVVCTRGDKWGLPKGGRRAGETRHECAEREVLEETSVRVTIDRAQRGRHIYSNFIVYIVHRVTDASIDIDAIRAQRHNDSTGVGWIYPECLRQMDVPKSSHLHRVKELAAFRRARDDAHQLLPPTRRRTTRSVGVQTMVGGGGGVVVDTRHPIISSGEGGEKEEEKIDEEDRASGEIRRAKPFAATELEDARNPGGTRRAAPGNHRSRSEHDAQDVTTIPMSPRAASAARASSSPPHACSDDAWRAPSRNSSMAAIMADDVERVSSTARSGAPPVHERASNGDAYETTRL
jgi:ADP-ribose pyrophosphatase YjhB (NUDIX family)